MLNPVTGIQLLSVYVQDSVTVVSVVSAVRKGASGCNALTNPLYPSGHPVPLLLIVRLSLGNQVCILEFQQSEMGAPGTSEQYVGLHMRAGLTLVLIISPEQGSA